MSDRCQILSEPSYRERIEAWLAEWQPPGEPESLADLMRAALGIRQPRLYALGFSHNNCGGFCIKAGHAHFANLLRTLPDRYAFHEEQEEALRATLGDYAILNDRSGGGPRRPVPLRVLRERVESGGSYDLFDYGGCGCFSGEEA